jgi:hypothetical protein
VKVIVQSSKNKLDKTYFRKKREDSVLYQVVSQNYNSFLHQVELEGGYLPNYVKEEFESYLECGILAYGFLRLKCKDCGKEKLLGFSCKKRGICPSCGGRRMSETSAHLVNNTIPRVKVRQWVLSVPFSLRYQMSSNPSLQSSLLRIVLRVITGFYKKRIKLDYKVPYSKTGAVTLIQRFGSSINLNVHYHILFLDGAYDGENFLGLRSLSNAEVARVLTSISKRVIRYLIKKGYLNDVSVGADYIDEFNKSEPLLSSCVRASISNRIALGARRGERVRRIGNGFGNVGDLAVFKSSRCYSLNGFSLHADRMVSAYSRKSLESLCTYITRPAISEERLAWTVDGNVSYKLKRPYSDGTTDVLFSPLELMEKLAALVPKPRANLIRYHGVLAPNSKIRSSIVPKYNKLKTRINSKESIISLDGRLSFSKLLKRVFNIDVEKCESCGGRLEIISVVRDRSVIRKILKHIGIGPDPPKILGSRINENDLYYG